MTTERRQTPSAALAHRVASFLLVGAVIFGAGCGHAHTVGGPEAPNEKSRAEAGAPDEPNTEPPPAVLHPRKVTSDLKGPNGERQNISISTSPGGLLKPGAAKAIQAKLSRDGDLHGDVGSDRDGPTHDALARFQRSHDLPATGVPDDATVRKLGLKPEDIFRSGNDHPHD